MISWTAAVSSTEVVVEEEEEVRVCNEDEVGSCGSARKIVLVVAVAWQIDYWPSAVAGRFAFVCGWLCCVELGETHK